MLFLLQSQFKDYSQISDFIVRDRGFIDMFQFRCHKTGNLPGQRIHGTNVFKQWICQLQAVFQTDIHRHHMLRQGHM